MTARAESPRAVSHGTERTQQDEQRPVWRVVCVTGPLLAASAALDADPRLYTFTSIVHRDGCRVCCSACAVSSA